MSLATYSLFYFGHTVDSDNQVFDFAEGGPELNAEIPIGSYSLSEYVVAVEDALNTAGALTYTVSLNRTTRKMTIAASGTFSLLVNSGTHASNSAFSMMGYSGANRTGAASYLATTTTGSSYAPQFILQDYISEADNRKANDATVLTTASGRVEVVRFGEIRLFEMNIRFATNITQPSAGPIRTTSIGVSNLQTFMQYLITKAPIEFMPDESVPGTYYKVILESTAADGKGLAYKLKERYDINIPGYFDTGPMTLRMVD